MRRPIATKRLLFKSAARKEGFELGESKVLIALDATPRCGGDRGLRELHGAGPRKRHSFCSMYLIHILLQERRFPCQRAREEGETGLKNAGLKVARGL